MLEQLNRFRNTLNAHPLLALATLGCAAAFSIPLGALLLATCVGVYVWPQLSKQIPAATRAESAVRSLQSETFRVVALVSASMADQRLLERRAEAERLQSITWRARAEKAMLACDEVEARRCLAFKRGHDDARGRLLAELAKQRAAVDAMRPRVDELRAATREAEQRTDLLGVRARRAKARREIVMTATGLSTEGGRASFVRAAEEVARQEAEAEALDELLGDESAGGAPEAAWDRAERDEGLEHELDELRQRMGMRRQALGGGGGQGA